MTRRLTISGSRSEMGLLSEVADPDPDADPESSPSSWASSKHEFWRRPSKIQICMPRLKFIAKVLCGLLVFVFLFKILGQQPPPPPAPPAPTLPPTPIAPESPEDEFKEPTEKEMIEWAKREEWIWKDFTM